ncbi:sensor histidine kinase [Falsibacillus pallidus]|uniref:sensor histidine kinase n=1 Tax=Falsibacillus pallidus TaxID=493781 RepID=UPI003D98DD2B
MNVKKMLRKIVPSSQKEKDVFKQTQNRLTYIYSGMLMLFLLLFIGVVYALLYSIIFKGEEHDLQTSAERDGRSIEDFLVHRDEEGLHGFRNKGGPMKDIDQFFYYIVDSSGNLLAGDEMVPALRDEVLKSIGDWDGTKKEILQQSFIIHAGDFKPIERNEWREARPVPKKQTVRLLIASQPISINGEVAGTIYIGKDITSAYQLFRWLLIILAGMAVLFIGIAYVISRSMSRKAMVPIADAFARQREFTADASHELRTPLSVMLSSINAIEMTLEDEDPMARKWVSRLKDEVKRMTTLVSDLLTLARSDSGALQRTDERFDFYITAKNAVESVQALAESKRLSLLFQGKGPLLVHGDQQRLLQLLYILLDNAIKYTPDGGTLTLSAALDSSELVIVMEDSGIGIKQEDQERIFERFYRSDKSRSRSIGGHGLGLSIAKWIVEAHNGSIRVDSEEEKGSTFTVRMPIASGGADSKNR